MSDLQRAYDALTKKQQVYEELWEYYDGKHPLVYSVARLREVFQSTQTRFSENWCAVVVNAALDRLQIKSFTVENDEAATQRLNELWTNLEMHVDDDDTHLCALVTGEAFVIVWPDDATDDDGLPQAYFNDSRMCHVFYDAENPRRVSFAAKWWRTDAGAYKVVLYYPDRIEYYTTKGGLKHPPQRATAFAMERDPAPHDFGIVPVFHLRKERRTLKSELDDVLTIQQGINKLLADMMVSAEFGAFRQRWVISNADTGTLRNSPNEIWNIPGGDGVGQQTAVGEFSQTDLGNFLKAITDLVGAISAISRTPAHYFFHQGGAVPSGEALIALEAPLNKKVSRYIERFRITWQRVAAFLLRLDGTEVDPADITVNYESPETIQPRTKAEIRKINVESGLPLTTTLRREGWSDEELEQMRRDKVAEQAEAQQSLAAALIEQQRRFDQGSGNEADEGSADRATNNALGEGEGGDDE